MNQDRKLVASLQPYELRTICNRYKIDKAELKKIMLEITGTGKPARSREEIYKELEDRGYKVGGFDDTEKKETV